MRKLERRSRGLCPDVAPMPPLVALQVDLPSVLPVKEAMATRFLQAEGGAARSVGAEDRALGVDLNKATMAPPGRLAQLTRAPRGLRRYVQATRTSVPRTVRTGYAYHPWAYRTYRAPRQPRRSGWPVITPGVFAQLSGLGLDRSLPTLVVSEATRRARARPHACPRARTTLARTQLRTRPALH